MDYETLSEAKDTPAVERDDDLVDHVYLYLRDSAYPKQCSPSMKRQIRLRSKKFELRNGELYYRLGERDVSCWYCMQSGSIMHVYSRAKQLA